MSSECEEYERALRIIHTWLSVGGPPTIDKGIEQQLGAIRTYVTELEAELVAVRAEAEKWERLAKEFQSQRNEFESDNDKLRARIKQED